MMYAAWGVLSFFLLVTQRYMVSFYKCRHILHTLCGIAVGAIFFISLLYAGTSSEAGVENWLLHNSFGTIDEGVIIAILATGFASLLTMRMWMLLGMPRENRYWMAKIVRKGH